MQHTSSLPTAIDMQTLHRTPQQTFEKDPQIFISPVSILPPSHGVTVSHEEPPQLLIGTSRPTAALEHARRALIYVQTRERESWSLLESLACNSICNSAIDRLKTGMMAGRHAAASGNSRVTEAYRNVERTLGKWVVHDYTYNGAEYSPAAAEPDVIARCAGGGCAGLQEQFEKSIDTFAKNEKTAYKKELDARKEALEGVLSPEHAKLVNNQKSAHLSKFMSVVASRAKDRMITWLMESKYGNGTTNYSFFDQHIAM